MENFWENIVAVDQSDDDYIIIIIGLLTQWRCRPKWVYNDSITSSNSQVNLQCRKEHWRSLDVVGPPTDARNPPSFPKRQWSFSKWPEKRKSRVSLGWNEIKIPRRISPSTDWLTDCSACLSPIDGRRKFTSSGLLPSTQWSSFVVPPGGTVMRRNGTAELNWR